MRPAKQKTKERPFGRPLFFCVTLVPGRGTIRLLHCFRSPVLVGVRSRNMNYFKRLGIAVIIDAAALLFAAFFLILGGIVPFGEGFRVPIFVALLVSGFLGIARYMSSHKTAVLFDHSSLLLGAIKLVLAFMSLIPVNPSDIVYFVSFGFLMTAAGMSHFENMMVIQRVKGVLWPPALYISVLVTGIGIMILIAAPPVDGRGRLILALCLIVEALASLFEVFLLSRKLTELHEAALKIADDVKEAIKKDDPPAADNKTVINLLPLQNVNMLSPEEVKKLQKDGALPGASSALSVSAKPADKILYQEGEEKAESAKPEGEKKKKKVTFPDDIV